MRRFALFLFVLAATGIAQNPQWKIYKPTNTGVQGDYSFGVAVDNSGRLWANGHDPVWDEGGAVMYDGRVWHNWSTVDSAVPDEELTSFNVDSSGNVWCASIAGLSKFDGQRWTTYNRSNEPSFPCDAVTDIDVDSAGSVWFALSSVDSNAGGVGRFDGDSFKFWNSYTGLPWPGHSEYVLSIGCGPGGVVYAGAAGVGVARYENGIWTYLSDSVTGDVDDIVVDLSGVAWFAMQVLLSYDHGVWSDHGFSGSLPILGLAPRKAGGVWVGAPNGLFSYSNGTWTSMNWPGSFCYAAAESPDGSVWAGGIGGIAHYSGGRWVLYNTQNVGLSNRWINGIDFDSNHNVWVSTSGGGIDRFDGETWMGFNPYNGGMFPWPYPTDAVQASVEGPDGNIWAGTYGQGIAVWNDTNWIRRYMETWVIDNIVRDSTGGLWCTASSGLYHFEGDTWRRFDFLNSPLPSYVTGVCADIGGYVWVTNLGGLFRTDGVNWEDYSPDSAGMPGPGNCWTPARAPDGTLWLAAALDPSYLRSALVRFRREDTTWTVYDSTNSPLKACGVVAVTSTGVLWIGYFRGAEYPPRGAVARFEGSNWTVYDRDNSPLPHEQIYDISIDWNDNPWISCASEGMAVIYDNPLPVQESHEPQTSSFKLRAFPNPFRTRTAISLQLAADSRANLAIFDAGGRRVRTLSVSRSSYAVWDGRDDIGRPLPSGAYFIHCDVAGKRTATRIVLQR
jgi:ligand-binding sensor domain-containing protein